MTQLLKRQQIHVDLLCPRCAAKGAAMWEENSEMTPQGPQSKLLSLSGPFGRQAGAIAGQPEITCLSCGTVLID
jgi:hypothetical protein